MCCACCLLRCPWCCVLRCVLRRPSCGTMGPPRWLAGSLLSTRAAPPRCLQVTDAVLTAAFQRFPTFQKAKVRGRLPGHSLRCCFRCSRRCCPKHEAIRLAPPTPAPATRILPHPPLPHLPSLPTPSTVHHHQPTTTILPQVIRFSHNGKSKGYGFVSFGDQAQGAQVIKEMNGKYVGEWTVAANHLVCFASLSWLCGLSR